MSDNEKEKVNKAKAVALAMVVSMVISNPFILTGCTNSQPRTVVDEEEMQKKETGSSNAIFYGGGHSSPFIFRSPIISGSNVTGTSDTISNAGWKSWTAPSTSGGYSGVHMSGFSS
jgi:hypothetical protein